MSLRFTWKRSACGVVQTRLPMRPLPRGIPSSLRGAGASYRRSAREIRVRRSAGAGEAEAAASSATKAIVVMGPLTCRGKDHGLDVVAGRLQHALEGRHPVVEGERLDPA